MSSLLATWPKIVQVAGAKEAVDWARENNLSDREIMCINERARMRVAQKTAVVTYLQESAQGDLCTRHC